MRFQPFFAALMLTLALMPPAKAAVSVGSTAPDFTARDAAGTEIQLSSFKGKPVVLEWTNHLCPFVMKHYGSNNMQDTQAFAAGKGAVWISILSSATGKQGHVSAEEALKIAVERGARPTHIVLDEDGKIGRMYGAKTTPHLYVIDAEGALAYMGAIDDKPTADKADVEGATNYVKAALEALAAGKKPEVAESQPYGCSVKYAD